MTNRYFPSGWDEERVHQVLAHYETQTEDEAVTEDESAFREGGQTAMGIPVELVPAIRQVIAQCEATELYATGGHAVILAPDVAEFFPDSESVNEALRALIKIIRQELKKVAA
jgi:hypothetical protein